MNVATVEHCQEHFPDEPKITDDVQMLRRIPPFHFVKDENIGGIRPSSAAFEDDEDGHPMSLYRRNVIEYEGGSVDRVMAGHHGYGLASVTAAQLRSRQQTNHPNPLPDEAAHAVACGPKTHSNRKFLARRAVWVIPPPT